MPNHDVTVYNGGTLFNLELHTPAACEWVAGNLAIEAWQWITPTSFAVESRYAADIVDGMVSDGGLRVK